ncbi:5'-methylthioadenosine/S-adenosylhomocysteine nucleosidase [Glycomyces harbinensis]|uniref:Nucleoside phosphorylase n=1 Tax=Glycomyces harbinensis TaxID=58114 RepID=A0A1G7BXL4_9ACTN|nr:5'-methylthioadenosine/S-adenosylhomocysteine nucleosidase [Glycomyces harbinensis]SDE31320.1 Nucleoside phosphorylase [Glycomyces harbinensis]
MNDLPIAVLATPIDVERRAVLELLSGTELTEHDRDGIIYRTAEFEGRHGDWNLVLAMTGRGNERAAAAVEHALSTWRPQLLILCGVAGGLRDAQVGDVVAATKVYGYESGQDTDEGLRSRPESLPTSFTLHQQAQLLVEHRAWSRRLGTGTPPRVYHRPIASGSKVVTGRESETAELVRRQSGDAQAIDTESYGAMAAASRKSAVEATVVRGVSDLLAGKTKAADRLHQPLAARNAAAFSLALIASTRPKSAEIRPLAGGTGSTYIGVVGPHSQAVTGAMGDNARGSVVINNRGWNGRPDDQSASL